MGRDKVWEKFGGKPLIERVVSRLGPLSNESIIITAEGKDFPTFDRDQGVQVIRDLYPNKGSLGGIYTGLAKASSFHSLVIACDMPFLNIPLLRNMMELSPGFDVIMPRIKGKPEPLHAVYSKSCLSPIEALLKQNELKIICFLDQVRVRYLDEAEIQALDPTLLSFFNINTEADLTRAQALIEEEKNVPSQN